MWSFNDKSEQLEHGQIGPDEQVGAKYSDAEIVKQLQKAQAMNAEFEAERAMYMRENSLLRQELEKVRLAKLGAQAARDEALKEFEVERTKIQEEMAKWEEQKKALADGLTAAREEAKKRQEEADRKMREQSAEFDRKVKETEERAKEEQRKLKVDMDKMSSERAAADKKLEVLENAQKAAASHSLKEQARIQSLVDEARKDKEATDRKHRDLLRTMRAQVSVFLAL